MPFDLDGVPCNGIDLTAHHRAHIRALNVAARRAQEAQARREGADRYEVMCLKYPIAGDGRRSRA